MTTATIKVLDTTTTVQIVILHPLIRYYRIIPPEYQEIEPMSPSGENTAITLLRKRYYKQKL
jgi:hypothetical protein